MKTLLFNVEQGEHLSDHIAVVLAIAEKYGSHVVASHITPLLSNYLPYYHGYFVADGFTDTLMEQWTDIAKDTQHTFETHWPDPGPPWEWTEEIGDAVAILGEQARLADVTIVSIDNRELPNGKNAWALASDLTVANGLPVLALPTNCSAPLGSDAALIAWDGSQEASHAVRHALPMLKAASKIIVVEVGENNPKEISGLDIAPFLVRHGLEVDALNRVPEGTIAQELLDVAHSYRAEFIVMGAYGHMRLREFIFGGVTREILQKSDIPLFICN